MKKATRIFGMGSYMIALMITGFGCSGSSNDGASILTLKSADTYTMSGYFPLTSSWETDQWTLFIDQREHEIQGVITKGMVDTQSPRVLYWTNDANGLQLHGAMKDDGTLWLPSTPLIIADATMEVGHKKEGTFVMDGEAFQYVSELSDKEDVSVPAGNFSECLKFRILIYPAGEDPDEFGSETMWLVEDVGFVKGETEENADGWILTRPGQTRRLLSFYITPSTLPPGPQGIKDLLRELTTYFEGEDLDGVMRLFSDDFLDSCVDKVTARGFFAEIYETSSELSWFSSPGDIESIGDVAYATTENLRSGEDGGDQRWWEWERGGTYWREEGGEWRVFGNQVRFMPSFSVFTRNDAVEDSYLAISAVMRDCDGEKIDMDTDIDDLAIMGPPSTDIDFFLKRDWNPVVLEYFRAEEITDAKNGFYTFTLFTVEGDLIEFTDYLQVMPLLDIPNLVFPIGGVVMSTYGVLWWPPIVDVTFDWDGVERADYYIVDLQYDEAGTWRSFAMEEVGQSQITLTLPRGRNWRWKVSARQNDRYGELDNESRSDWEYFTMPQ